MKQIILLVIISFSPLIVFSDQAKFREIIERFIEAETRLQEEFQNYTYSNNILFQELDDTGRVAGERLVEYDVYFDTSGERQVRKTRDHGRLDTIRVTKEDLEDAVYRQPFVLSRKTASSYQIEYVGRELVDELDTYVFDLKPKKKKKKQRYFEGRIYVDEVDFQIVMTRGKIVPDYRNNKFPAFETVRAEIEKGIWFPIWTGADDYLRFGRNRRVRIKQVITYDHFQRFEVDTSIKFDPEEPVTSK